MEKEESVKQIIKETIEHNPNHYITISLFGKKIRPCARCFGQWLGIAFSFILTSPFWLGFLHSNNFTAVFIISWILVLPAILDWSTVELRLRKGNNKIRFTVGFFYGTGIIVYLFVLPANIFLKIISYALYEIIFHSIRSHRKKKKSKHLFL